MKSIFALLLIIICLNAKSQIIPYKGDYPDLPYQVVINMPFDLTWNKLISFFSTKNYPIHVSDKNEGLIVSDRFNINWTYEKKWILKDTTALIVVPMFYNYSNNTVYPQPKFNAIITAEINVKLKDSSNKTIISFDITNVQKAEYSIKDGNTKYVPYYQFKSTGYIEKVIYNYLQH